MVRLGSANLGNRSDKVVLKGLKRLARKTDAIGVQESGDRLGLLQRFCDETGWLFYFADEPGSASVAILWNPKTVNASEPGVRPCTEATDCGNCGAGPDVVKAKVWNKIRLHPVGGGDPVVFINGHMPASLYCECRNRLGNDMIDELADMVEKRKGRIRVAVVMDGNSRPWAKRWKPLRELGMKQHTNFPTHTVRVIDLTWTLHIKSAKARPLLRRYSDHRWVILVIP